MSQLVARGVRHSYEYSTAVMRTLSFDTKPAKACQAKNTHCAGLSTLLLRRSRKLGANTFALPANAQAIERVRYGGKK